MTGDKATARATKKAAKKGTKIRLDSGLTLDFDKLLDLEMEMGRQRLFEQAYAELCEGVTGKAPSDTPPNEEEFKEQVRAYILENRDRLHQKICVELDYCKKRKKWGSLPSAVQGLVLIAGVLADFMATAGVASASWLVISGLLDELCECAKA